jgi:hypothetical protein
VEESKRAVAEAKTAVADAQKDLDTVSAEHQKVQQKLEAARSGRSRALAVAKLFTWGDAAFDVYLQTKKWGTRDYLQKQLGVVAYLCELTYDLMIAEADNVTQPRRCCLVGASDTEGEEFFVTANCCKLLLQYYLAR